MRPSEGTFRRVRLYSSGRGLSRLPRRERSFPRERTSPRAIQFAVTTSKDQVIHVWTFKTKGEKIKRGNYDVETTCEKGHSFFIKRGDKAGDYECPYSH